MQAAVIRRFDHPPVYGEFDDPLPTPNEIILTVSAAALTPLAKSQTSRTPNRSGSSLPLIPGMDGVGRRPDGGRVYFGFPRPPFGAMAERVPAKSACACRFPTNWTTSRRPRSRILECLPGLR